MKGNFGYRIVVRSGIAELTEIVIQVSDFAVQICILREMGGQGFIKAAGFSGVALAVSAAGFGPAGNEVAFA